MFAEASHRSRRVALADRELNGFDGQTRLHVRMQRPDRYRHIESLPGDLPRIARGAGVSYVAASFGSGVVSQAMGAFNRLLAFDAENGRLRVEAGTSVGAVQDFALPRGWYLPVTPGHPAATLGGCLGADVHGKNPASDGTFRRCVECFEMFHPVHGWCRADAGQDPSLFDTTIGGMGLTGTVVTLDLKLKRAPAGVEIRHVPVPDFATAEITLRAHAGAVLLYGWHDPRPGAAGRGVIRVAHALDHSPPGRRGGHHLPARVHAWPLPGWNRASAWVANAWLDARWRQPGVQRMAFADALFPMNAAGTYFAAFGPRGMFESQWLLPHAHFADFAAALDPLVRRYQPVLTLISSKLFDGRALALAFDGQGVALSLQMVADRRSRKFLQALTELALSHRGRPNLIKDSSLDAASVRGALPELDAFRQRLDGWDAERLCRSELSRRLEL